MHARLKALVRERQVKGDRPPDSDGMRSDETLGAFLAQLADRTITGGKRAETTLDYWVAVALDQDLCQKVLDEALRLPSYTFIYETEGGLIAGLDPSEPEQRAAVLWCSFLWCVYMTDRSLVDKAWSAVRTASERLWGRDQEACERVLHTRLPRTITEIIDRAESLTDDQKAAAWIGFDLALREEVSERFQQVHARQHPPFTRD
jgi:hypothetical protein